MTHSNKVTRRDFTVSSALAFLSGVTITITGCGDSGGPTTPAPTTPAPTPPAPTTTTPPASSDVTGTVDANHGHTAVITDAQLTSAATVRLDITGTSNHPHTVELTSADLDQIAAGTQVSKTSSVDADHDHLVTFN